MKTLGMGAKILTEVRSEKVEFDGKEIEAFVVSNVNQPKMVFVPQDDILVGQLYRIAENQAACRCGDKLVLVSKRKWTVPIEPTITQLVTAYEEAIRVVMKQDRLT